VEGTEQAAPAGTSSVTGALALTVLTLFAYYYYYLYRSLRRFEEAAPGPPEPSEVRRVRWAVTSGIALQMVAVLVLLAPVAPLLTDPSSQDALWKGIAEGRLAVPAGMGEAASLAELFNWGGWILFWAPPFVLLARALRAYGQPDGVAGFAVVLIGLRILTGLAGLIGWGSSDSTVWALDGLLDVSFVGCFVAATNAVWIARATARAVP